MVLSRGAEMLLRRGGVEMLFHQVQTADARPWKPTSIRLHKLPATGAVRVAFLLPSRSHHPGQRMLLTDVSRAIRGGKSISQRRLLRRT